MPGVVEYPTVAIVSSQGAAAAVMKGPNASASTVEKKRNKLGYHRTSVACVHCRRRKIRCEAAVGDPQGRCVDCIKLKKDCKYYPVDQQPPVEKKPRQGPRVEMMPSSSSSPLAMAGGTEAYYPYQSIPLSPGQEVSVSTFNAGDFVGNQMSSFAAPDQNVASADFVPAPSSVPVPWNGFTAMSDTHLLTSMTEEQRQQQQQQMMNLQPNLWSSPGGTPVAQIPSNPPTQQDTMNSAHAHVNVHVQSPNSFAMQPAAPPVWQVPLHQPTRSMSMSFATPPDMPPSPYTTNQFLQHQQQMVPPPGVNLGLRRSMTSPGPAETFCKSPMNVNMNANMNHQSPSPQHQHQHQQQQYPNNPPQPPHMNPQSPPPAEFQPSPVAVPASYPNAHPNHQAMGYPTWQDMNSMAGMNMNMNMDMNMNVPTYHPMYSEETLGMGIHPNNNHF